MSGQFVHALALGLDAGWRRLPREERCATAADLAEVLATSSAVKTFTYSTIGIETETVLLLWSLGPSLEAIEELAAGVLRSGLGSWMHVRQSFLGVIRPSRYVKRPTEQEQSMFTGARSRYLVVYPFTKSTEWYLLAQDERQKIMNEHMKVGHAYKQVRQLLAYSFGVDDMDFLVAYETDDLEAFGDLVRELRGTESRRSTVRDTPIITAVHRSFDEIARMLGAV